MQTYCSDALEEAMVLAQTKAINSYSFRDCLNYLNYQWRDIYQRMSIAEEGYYSKTIRLTQRLTKLPPFIMNTVSVYRAQTPTQYNRQIYRASGMNEIQSSQTYHISGFDVYCRDAEHTIVWLNYVPQPPFLYFTKNSRDPKVYESVTRSLAPGNIANDGFNYSLYTLIYTNNKYILRHKNGDLSFDVDITDTISRESWTIEYICCDFPYIFISYKHQLTGEYSSYIFKDMLTEAKIDEFNCFSFTGRNSNVEYYKTTWNDYTGMGVIVLDHDDDKFKEMGFTPDTLLTYPVPEMYRLFVAKLAEKFSALNESNLMGVANELASAQHAFDTFLKKDKSSWSRITNVNLPTMGDYL